MTTVQAPWLGDSPIKITLKGYLVTWAYALWFGDMAVRETIWFEVAS